MKNLLYAMVVGLVENNNSINIIEYEPDENGIIVFQLSVSPEDMGRIIGKHGKIAKALRTIMRACAARNDKKVSIIINN